MSDIEEVTNTAILILKVLFEFRGDNHRSESLIHTVLESRLGKGRVPPLRKALDLIKEKNLVFVDAKGNLKHKNLSPEELDLNCVLYQKIRDNREEIYKNPKDKSPSHSTRSSSGSSGTQSPGKASSSKKKSGTRKKKRSAKSPKKTKTCRKKSSSPSASKSAKAKSKKSSRSRSRSSSASSKASPKKKKSGKKKKST